jgi:hypothetical protein
VVIIDNVAVHFDLAYRSYSSLPATFFRRYTVWRVCPGQGSSDLIARELGQEHFTGGVS